VILRTWRGYASPANPTGYPDHFRRRVAPELAAVPGFRGATLVKEERAGEIEFLVLTLWDSMEAIRAFAGHDPAKAIVEPGAIAALRRYDTTVRHYEVLEEVTSAADTLRAS
jgi:heme-degrading monooxygenase HmoA